MITMPIGKGWPHVIVRREPQNQRFEVKIGNVMRSELIRPAAFAFFQAGAVDPEGRLTPAGRTLVTEGVRERLRSSRSDVCIVWGPRSCTWLDVRDIEGDDPPLGEPGDSSDWRRLPVITVPGRWLELHPKCDASHVFRRGRAHDRVEISSAAPMQIGWWNEPPHADETNPFEMRRKPNGDFAAPSRFRYRGVDVNVSPDGRLLGPVQPDGVRSIVTAPWPGRVMAACCEIAGRSISCDLMYAAWRAVDADRNHHVITEVRRAA